MSEKKYVVPADMLRATAGCGWHQSDCERILKIGLRWLAENPIAPTVKDAGELWARAHNVSVDSETGHAGKDMLIEWQRRMFLAPEPEIPEAVKDLVVDLGISPELSISRKQFNRDILEAYRRGTLSHDEK